MTRKDASATQTPTEQYRKQIGKQDWKKSKKDVKAQKRAADQQSQSGVAAALSMVAGMLVLVLGLYGFLYWYLGKALHQSSGSDSTDGEKPL